MKEDIDALGVRVDRLLGLMKKLSDENLRLNDELDQSKKECASLEQRMSEARVRVEAALARMPLPSEPQSQETA